MVYRGAFYLFTLVSIGTINENNIFDLISSMLYVYNVQCNRSLFSVVHPM